MGIAPQNIENLGGNYGVFVKNEQDLKEDSLNEYKRIS